MVVHVRLCFVVLLLGLHAAVLVRVDQRGMVVVVLVIRRAVFELAHRATLVVMGHMPVVVRVDLTLVLVHVLDVADHFLSRRGMDSHVVLLMRRADAPAVPF